MTINKDYNKNKSDMSEPWIVSPFFDNLLDNSVEMSSMIKEYAQQFNSKGYVILDLGLDDQFIDNLQQDIIIHLDSLKKQSDSFHYNDSPRVFEAWKNNKYVREIACKDAVMTLISLLYDKQPKPFQTINFIKGSSQPEHSDTIHFHTIPHRWMVGAWTALEDIDEDNGALFVYPGSHKLPIYEFHHLNLGSCEFNQEQEVYKEYENFLQELMKAKGLVKTPVYLKKGETIIWESNIIHGGMPVLDNNRTRWSQATHYYFPGCSKYFCPMYSDTPNGKYAEKDLSGKDILGMYEQDLRDESSY